LQRVVFTSALLLGVVSTAPAQELTDQELRVLMAEAQQGIAESEYRLGQYYEDQYELGLANPDAPADHTALLLAYAWFHSAEKSGHGEASYARIATEYGLRDVLSDDEYRQAIENVQEWTKDQTSQSPPQSAAAAPIDTTPADPAPADMEQPIEAFTELAAGDEDRGSTERTAEATDANPQRTTAVQSDNAVQMAALPPSDPTDTAAAAGPTIEDLLTRGTSFLDAGDLVSARGFFKMAAGMGSGEAAMLVGVTYDPGYLELINAVGLRPNFEQAEAWYLKAIDMENDEAKSRLQTLKERLVQREQ